MVLVRQTRISAPRLWPILWLSLLLLAGGLALFLTWRRIEGALVQSPPGAALIVAAIGLVCTAALLRIAAPRQIQRELAFVLPGVAAILVLAAVSLPGTSQWGIAGAWLVMISTEAATWWHSFNPHRQAQVQSGPEPPSAVAAGSGLNDCEEPEIPDGLVQQVTRVQESANRESIHALVQANIPAGDRLAIVHLAFCPPLAARPELTAHAIDADEIDVKVTQLETFGARLEARLPQVTEQPQRVMIEVLGSATSPPDA
jgi:hypothetical protein